MKSDTAKRLWYFESSHEHREFFVRIEVEIERWSATLVFSPCEGPQIEILLLILRPMVWVGPVVIQGLYVVPEQICAMYLKVTPIAITRIYLCVSLGGIKFYAIRYRNRIFVHAAIGEKQENIEYAKYIYFFRLAHFCFAKKIKNHKCISKIFENLKFMTLNAKPYYSQD